MFSSLDSPPQEHNNFIIILKYLLFFNHNDWSKWWHLIFLYFITFIIFFLHGKNIGVYLFRCQRSCPIFVHGIFSKCGWWYSYSYKIGVINQMVITIPIIDIWLKIIHKKSSWKKGRFCWYLLKYWELNSQILKNYLLSQLLDYYYKYTHTKKVYFAYLLFVCWNSEKLN